MIKSVEEGLETYKEELRKYKTCTDKLNQQYQHKSLFYFDWADYDKVIEWNAKLEGMILALGLTKSEEEKIDREVGIKS